MPFLAVFPLAFALCGVSDGPLDSRSIAGNGTASVLLDRAPVLGIDFGTKSQSVDEQAAPSVEQKALNRASPGAWLDAQIQVPDDSIAEPPQVLRDYLESRRDTVWTIVAALEKQSPEWIEPKRQAVMPFPYLMPSIRLQKVLIALALIEERDGNLIGASRALEASWSLDRPLAERALLVHQIASVAAQRWQTGALRKMAEPPLQWLGRLSNNDLWRRFLESVASDAEWSDTESSLPASDPSGRAIREAPDAIAGALARLPPCEAAALGEEDVWRLAERGMAAASSLDVAEVRRMYREISLPNMLDMMRRTARLSVDRELTLQILDLRLARAGDPDDRWPEKLVNPGSTVCPGAFYGYRSEAQGMEIRFDGSILDPPSGSILPLSFRSVTSRREPGPQPPPLTPTPEGAMIAPP